MNEKTLEETNTKMNEKSEATIEVKLTTVCCDLRDIRYLLPTSDQLRTQFMGPATYIWFTSGKQPVKK
jgi:hypothetical protein